MDARASKVASYVVVYLGEKGCKHRLSSSFVSVQGNESKYIIFYVRV